MASYRPRGGYGPSDQSQRPLPRAQRDDFYDDRRSSSRSPDRRHSPPHRRRSPPHDIPRGPRASNQDTYRNSSYGGRSPDQFRDRSPDRRDYRKSVSPRRGRGYYDTDRPRTGSERRSRSSSQSSGRASSRGRPSKEIMMEGLAAHLTENDVSAELKQNYKVDGIEDVRVIRDRQTKQSRQFGFIRFSTLNDARDFMDHHYPTIYLYGDSNNSSGNTEESKVRINYGRERKDNRPDEDDWICAFCNINNFSTRVRCFRCQATKAESAAAAPSKASNVGDNDASPDNSPSQFLLLRGLEPSVSEELFAKGVAKLNKPAHSTSQSNTSLAKKGAKVASTTGDSNLGARDGTLRRVLLVRDRRSNESWRYGFAEYASIEDAQAATTRYNSFDRFTIASKQVLVSYIHAGVFVPVLNPTPSTKRFTFSPLANPSLKLAYWDEDAYVTELLVSAPEPAQVETKPSHADAAESEGLKSAKEMDKAKKRKVQMDSTAPGTKKATPSHLQFWSNRHAELHGIEQKKTSQVGSDAGGDSGQPPTQSFADPNRHCCYLCMRSFNSAADVNAHERLSELHRQNLKDEVKVKKAHAKLEKHGVEQQTAQSMEYRDRARERRKIYGVVNKKGEQVGKTKLKASAPGSDEETTAAPLPSKGASLLSKMGYTAGQGLGASGEGMTAPISQDIYVAGVGLGAQGGKLGDAVEEAEKNTKGDYSSFAESVRKGARERYARM